MKKALYLNKFGIMHKGLIEVVKDIEQADDVDEIILGICSSQYNDKEKSPSKDWIYNCLTWEERKKIMEISLQGVKKKIHYVPLPDLYPIDKSVPENKWIDDVVRRTPDFDIIYSERDVERECLEHKGKEVRDIKKHVLFTDHCIRDKMARDEAWQPYFDPEAAKLLEEINTPVRYKILFSKTPKVMGDVEWRTFDPGVEALKDKVLGMTYFDERHSVDLYVLSLVRSSINMKVTQSSIKIKHLERVDYSNEWWKTEHWEFPFSAEDFKKFSRATRFPQLALEGEITHEKFIKAVPDYPNPYAMLVPVRKHRHMRLFEHKGRRMGIEFINLNVFDNDYVSLGVEAENAIDMKRTMNELGLSIYDHRNYIQFLEEKAIEKYGDEIFENMWVK